MKVKNMTSAKGNKIANQFIIDDNNGNTFFQSYNSIICKVNFDEIVLDKTYWNYSVTTSKYLNKFLCMTTKEVKEKIKSGLYKLADLNTGVSSEPIPSLTENTWRS